MANVIELLDITEHAATLRTNPKDTMVPLVQRPETGRRRHKAASTSKGDVNGRVESGWYVY